MGPPTLIEVLARDGSVQRSLKIVSWPLQVGRDLDTDLILDDVHTAGLHFCIEADDDGVYIIPADTLNGVQADGQRLAAGTRWPVRHASTSLVAGRTHLRLRLGGHPLPAELPLQAAQSLTHGIGSLLLLILLTAGAFAFDTYLGADQDAIERAMTSRFIGLLGVLLAWCGAWALMSKIFNHRSHFWWHVRVLLSAVLVWLGIDSLSALLAFSLSWPWVTDFDFIPKLALSAIGLYFHLQAVEPHHRKMTRALAAGALIVGLSLNLWNNWQASSRFGAELYMSHLFPPSLRLAKPVALDTFMQRTQKLQDTLDTNVHKEPDEEGNEAKEAGQ